MPSLKSIKTKITLTVAVIVLFYTVLLVFLTYGVLGDMAERNASELAGTILEETDKHITRFFQDMEELALSFREYPPVYEADLPRLRELILATVRSRRSFMRAVYLGTEDGQMHEWGYGEGFVNNEPSFPPGYDPRKRPWYRSALETGGFVVTDPYLYASIEAFGITCAVPVDHPSGERIGVLGFDIMLEDLRSLVAGLDIGMNGKALLIDRKGGQLVNQFESKLSDFTDRSASKPSGGSFTAEAGGEPHLITYTENETTGWTLFIGLPLAEVMTTTNRAIRFGTALDLLLMILLLITLEWTSRRMLIEPVEHMVETIERMRGGDANARMQIRHEDEFGTLARNFNLLAETVKEYTDEMERKVKERTDRLQILQQENVRLRIIEEKEKIYGYLHDSLGSRLTNIVISNNVARSALTTDPKVLSEMHDRIEENAQAGLEDLKDILASSSEGERNMFDFRTILELQVRKRLELKNIRFSFEGNPEEMDILPGTLLVELEKILQELVSNVLKHADAEHVSLRTELTYHTVSIGFEDDGAGFDPQEITERSFGLANMRSRVDRRGGVLHIRSAPGSGTSIVIELPLEEAKTEDRA